MKTAVGLTRAAGVMCCGDGWLTAALVRAAALPGWIIVGRVLQWPKFARESYRANQPKGRFLTLLYRPTQPKVVVRSQRWVNPPDISIAPKQAKPINPKSVPHSRWLCLCHATSLRRPSHATREVRAG